MPDQSKSLKNFSWKPFIVLNMISLFLIATLAIPAISRYWLMLDTSAFTNLNHYLDHKPIEQFFWAFVNVKITDLFGAFFMFGFLALYIVEGNREERALRLAQSLFIVIWGEIGILFAKYVVFPIVQHIGYFRVSPSMSMPDPLLLSRVIPWLNVKDFSLWCFPADHAKIVFQWASLIYFFGGRRLGIYAMIMALMFSLPRLLAGAHWLSDLIVGSGSIVVFMLAFSCYTPLYGYLMRWLTCLTSKFFPEYGNRAITTPV